MNIKKEDLDKLTNVAKMAFAFQTLNAVEDKVIFDKKDVQKAFDAFEHFKSNADPKAQQALHQAINECLSNQRTGFDSFAAVLNEIQL